jgi:formate dehydrogenase major subunit
MVFVPFAYREAAANLMTDPRLDPDGKIPEFKYCAARVRPGGVAPEAGSLGGGRILQVELA